MAGDIGGLASDDPTGGELSGAREEALPDARLGGGTRLTGARPIDRADGLVSGLTVSFWRGASRAGAAAGGTTSAS